MVQQNKTDQINKEVRMIEQYLQQVRSLSRKEKKVMQRIKESEKTKALVSETLKSLRETQSYKYTSLEPAEVRKRKEEVLKMISPDRYDKVKLFTSPDLADQMVVEEASSSVDRT
jgi:hypothetical protein